MATILDNEIAALKTSLGEMGRSAKKMLLVSIVAMKNQDIQLSRRVIEHKSSLLDMEDAIETKTLNLIAQFQPVDKDMRILASTIKMITYLQRIGQYGVELAKNAIEISKKPHISRLVSTPYMAEIAAGMIDDALKYFETDTTDGFETFADRFADVEELRKSIIRECLTYMMEDSKKISQCTVYMMSARFLERCADYACKLGEAVIYVHSGKRVEINCDANTAKVCLTKAQSAA